MRRKISRDRSFSAARTLDVAGSLVGIMPSGCSPREALARPPPSAGLPVPRPGQDHEACGTRSHTLSHWSDVHVGIAASLVRHMPPSPISPGGAPPWQEAASSGRSSALRGFIDDIAVLFAIMTGRDMVQRSPATRPDGAGSMDAGTRRH